MTTHYTFLKTWLQTLAKTERGASLVEYALLVALIAVVVIGAVTLLGGTAKETFEETNASLAA
ncbi:MAG: Flp family type IVb pilin [Microthrixaceae bacterium]